MFGFLRPSQYSRLYRQVYSGYCDFQRRKHGWRTAPFTSYEAVFLYLLAVEAGVVEPPGDEAPTCCRMGLTRSRQWKMHPQLTDCCISIAMLLAKVKLEDDVRDCGSWMARWVGRSLRKPFRESEQLLERLRPGIGNSLRQAVDEHIAMEKANRFSGLEEFAEPTGKAFGMVFDLFGTACGKHCARNLELRDIGHAIGAGIVLNDCVVDLPMDRKRGRFNPLNSVAEQEQASTLGLAHLARAEWRCSDLVGDTGVSVRLVDDSFRRMSGRATAKSCAPRSRFGWRNRVRRGDCDGCDACCSCCDGGGADGCAGEGCHMLNCCDGCDACSPCHGAECCSSVGSDRNVHGKSGSKKSVGVSEDKTESLVGRSGIAASQLNPSGLVRIESKNYPAKSDGTWIAPNTPVVVISETPFGVLVRAVSESNSANG